jgi:hypothetical protein
MSVLPRLRAPATPLLGPSPVAHDESGALAVAHLVWGPFGAEPLRRFVRSYREHEAGIEHELVLVLNGVTEQQRPSLLQELEGVAHRVVTLPEPVQDLTAYAQVAARGEYRRLCFLNSHSEILAPQWLANLSRALDEPGAGLVGATGSWASTRSWVLHSLGLPTAYRGVMPERKVARAQFIAIEREREGMGMPVSSESESPKRSLGDSLRAKLRTLPTMPAQLIGFEGFPAYHLRTNGFMVDRTMLERLRSHPMHTKMDAYELENGRHSLTRQVQAMGLRTLVVARDGEVYPHERWPLARTLWQGDQEGLMIADNQTRSYASGPLDRRRLLSAFAWGSQAEPQDPGSLTGEAAHAAAR